MKSRYYRVDETLKSEQVKESIMKLRFLLSKLDVIKFNHSVFNSNVFIRNHLV